MVKRLLAGLLLTMGLGIGSLALGGVAHATTCTTYGCGPTSPNGGPTPANVPAATPATGTQAATPALPPPSSSLAFTGADVVGTVVLGLVLIGGGLVIVRVTHRRRAHA